MPLRGETIGRAYVKIFADGSGFGDSVREQLRDDDDAFKQMGKRHSEAYAEGFEEQQESFNKQFVKGLEAGARRNRGRFDAIGEQIGSDLFAPIDKQFREAFGPDVGRQMSKDMREAFFMSGGVSDVLDQFVEDWEKNWHKATVVVDRETGEIERMLREQQHRLVEIEREGSLERMSIRQEEFLAAIQRIHKTVEIEEEASRRTTDIDRDRERSIGRLERAFRKLIPVMDKGTGKMHSFADGVARAFGKGSRNDFINFVGRMLGFFVSLPLLIPKAIGALAKFGAKITEVFGEEGATGVLKLFGTTLAQGVVGLIGLGVLAGVVAVSIGILSSAVMGLVGAIVAMAGSVTFALGGAALIVAGAVAPIAAAVGTVVLAVKNMDKETKKHFKEVGKNFKALGEEASKNIFKDLDFKAVEDVIKSLGKVTGPVSEQLGTMLDGLIDDLDSPAFRKFEGRLGKVLPPMVESLGTIFENVGKIIGNVFIAISPYTQEFLDWLVQVTDDFAAWTGSAKGKTAIEGFMERAKASLKSIGHFLHQAIGLIGDLFGVGQETGDNIFDTMADKIEEWRDKLKKAEEDGTLKKWFEDAKKVAGAIGGMIEKIAQFIDKMDTPENREMVQKIAKAFEGLIIILGFLLAAFNVTFGPIGTALIEALGWVVDVKNAFKDLGGTFRAVYNAMIGPALSQILTAIGFVLDKLGDMFEILGSIPGAPAWIGKTATALHGAAENVDTLSEAVKNIPDPDIQIQLNDVAIAARITHVGHMLGEIPDETVYVNVVTRLTGHPGPGAGGQDVTDTDPNKPGIQTSRILGSTAGRTVNVGVINVHTPTEDPKGVAAETVNRLAAAAYV